MSTLESSILKTSKKAQRAVIEMNKRLNEVALEIKCRAIFKSPNTTDVLWADFIIHRYIETLRQEGLSDDCIMELMSSKA